MPYPQSTALFAALGRLLLTEDLLQDGMSWDVEGGSTITSSKTSEVGGGQLTVGDG